MELGIIGFWHSGKTTLFNSLCVGRSETIKHPDDGWQSHLATIRIPDNRVDALSETFKPTKTTYATIRVIDVEGPPASQTEGQKSHHASLLEYQLHQLANVEGYLAVIRDFWSTDLPPVDVKEQISNCMLELILSDLSRIEHRLPGLEKNLTKVSGAEREHLLVEKEILVKAKEILEKKNPIITMTLSPEEEKTIRGFQFSSQRPIVFIINTDKEITECDDMCQSLREDFPGEYYSFLPLNAEIEKEIQELPVEEQQAFIDDYHILSFARDRVTHEVLSLMKKICFFTINPNELHVWLITQGTTALEAAGLVHSDFARGFIRAEVMDWKSCIEHGGFSHAKREGKVRSEGKSYIVQDGEIINFLFHV